MSRRKQLEQFLKSEPDDVFLNYALAMQLVAEGEEACGLDQLDAVIRLDADYVAAYFQKAQILSHQGEIELARDVLSDGIAVARRVGDAHAEAEMTEFSATL